MFWHPLEVGANLTDRHFGIAHVCWTDNPGRWTSWLLLLRRFSSFAAAIFNNLKKVLWTMFLTCSAPAIIIPCYSIVFGDFFASTAASKFSNAALLYPQFTKWVALNHDIYEAGRKEMQPMRNCSKPKMNWSRWRRTAQFAGHRRHRRWNWSDLRPGSRRPALGRGQSVSTVLDTASFYRGTHKPYITIPNRPNRPNRQRAQQLNRLHLHGSKRQRVRRRTRHVGSTVTAEGRWLILLDV